MQKNSVRQPWIGGRGVFSLRYVRRRLGAFFPDTCQKETHTAVERENIRRCRKRSRHGSSGELLREGSENSPAVDKGDPISSQIRRERS